MTLPPAVPAATLVVMREPAGQAGLPPELLIVERSAKMAFAAGMVVFPGGRIDPGDHRLAEMLGRPDAAGQVAAIRETLEESGIAAGFDAPPSAAAAAALQEALHNGVDFADLLADHGLALDLASLTPFARWCPAFVHARRFDTQFFLAAAPPDLPALRPQSGEVVDAYWASAADMLARIARGEAAAIFPTLRNLERLARFATLDQARRDAIAHGTAMIVPWIEQRDDGPHLCIPDDAGYPVTSEPMTDAVRG